MKLYLTSSIGGNLVTEDGIRISCPLDESHGLVEALSKDWKTAMKGLMIASDPRNLKMNQSMNRIFQEAFASSNLELACLEILMEETVDHAREYIRNSDVIILCGGHVPTQNTFFSQIRLGELLENYQGILIGISAGTMNCGDVVYAQPELEGEATDPEYQRFLKGLGLTNCSILPHFQYIRELSVDGLRTVEDMMIPDSYVHPILGLEDGSYLIQDGKDLRLYGDAWICEQGVLQKIQEGQLWELNVGGFQNS